MSHSTSCLLVFPRPVAPSSILSLSHLAYNEFLSVSHLNRNFWNSTELKRALRARLKKPCACKTQFSIHWLCARLWDAEKEMHVRLGRQKENWFRHRARSRQLVWWSLNYNFMYTDGNRSARHGSQPANCICCISIYLRSRFLLSANVKKNNNLFN